jgi:hypothetical protein
MSKRLKIAIVLLVNTVIAGGFYLENRNAYFGEISSDLANIIPVCKKIDNPALYQGDMYLADLADVEYYTPFYVHTLRIMARLTGGDYLHALNVLGFCAHLSYGVLWFLLLYKLRRDFWAALVFSVFMRGILWPPGGELLGISDLWTIMPRTLYAALAPLPFLVYEKLSKRRLFIAAFLLGLILNFHPISGVGVVICYATVFLGNRAMAQSWKSLFTREVFTAAACCLVGMLPYLVTYFANVRPGVAYDPAFFDLAFRKRLGEAFDDPVVFVRQWARPVLFFFAGLFAVFCFVDPSPRKRDFKILLAAICVLFAVSNGVVYAEQAVNAVLGKNIRMSFQLIRMQKFVLVLMQIATYLVLATLLAKWQVSRRKKGLAAAAFAVVLVCSTLPLASRIPLVGDDLITSILPRSMTFGGNHLSSNVPDRDEMMKFIRTTTPANAVVYGDYLVRAAADRSVILDKKGASMLIEGNAQKFVQWYLDTERLEPLPDSLKVSFLRAKGVGYIISETDWQGMAPVKIVGKYRLYKI